MRFKVIKEKKNVEKSREKTKNFVLAQLMSLCNQTVQFSSSLSLIFTPTSYSSCCNVTIRRASSNLSELIFLNVNQMLANSSPLKIFDDQLKSVNLTTYSTWNRTLMKSDVLQLPIIFSLCRFDVSPFEIFLTKIFKGKTRKIRIENSIFVV